MSKTKAAGTSRLGRDSIGRRLGVKLFAGQKANPGNIIIKQRGTKFIPGKNVKRGNDDSLYSVKEGIVQFRTTKKTKFNGLKRLVKIVDVIPKK